MTKISHQEEDGGEGLKDSGVKEGLEEGSLKPNTHRRRRRRRDETLLSRLVGVGGVYMNSQLAHESRRLPTDSAM